MGCPFHADDGEQDDEQRGDGAVAGGLDRRSFVQSALLIGGAGGLAGLARAGITPAARDPAQRPEGTDRIGRAARRNRQHAWDDYEPTVGTGNTAQPASSLILELEYRGEGEPAPGHRRQVAEALREIERHFAWEAEGLLFTVAYSASYFERFGEQPPEGARPWPAERVVEESSSLTPYDPEPDTADAVLLLASENPANPLAAEAALWGEDGDGVPEFGATFEGVFERPETWPARRVGEAGPEFQNTEATYEEFLADGQDIPDESPLSMGFVAGFGSSIPAEDAVTLTHDQRFPGPGIDEADVPDRPYVGAVGERDPGVFAQGTLKHLSYLTIDLAEWYDTDRERRRHQMYSPYHGAEETTSNGAKPGDELTRGERGDGPGTDDLAAREDAAAETDGGDVVYSRRVPETATGEADMEADQPTLAHSQKAARARYDVDGDGEVEQPCLRRDWDGIRPATDEYERRAGYHFNVPMRFNESIFTLLDANYGPEFASLDGRVDHTGVDPAEAAALDGERNGIAPFIEATRRNNWLVPPLTLRALPHPRALSVDVDVETHGDYHYVHVEDPAEGDLDPETVRFGGVRQVNQARGAAPVSWAGDGGDTLTYVFEADAVAADGEAKLFAKLRGSRRAVTGDADI